MCLLALVVVVKPLAQVIGGYLCCNGHDKINQDLNHRVTHLLSVARMEKGSATSITQALTQYNKKPPVLRIPGAFCLVLGECLIPGFDHVELRCPAFGLEGVCALGFHDALLRFPSVGGDFCCYFSQIL